MAKAKDDSKQPVVRRIKASDSTKPAVKRPQILKKRTVVNGEEKKATRNPFRKLIGYFKGAWFELRQVRWPNRRATWGMTAALVTFTAVFVVVILLIDLAFQNLFRLILGQ